MSYDFATFRQCPHEVLFESVAFDSFVKDTLRFPRIPANTSKINIYINGVDVPANGLYSYPSITMTKPEPYRIRAGVNDLIYLQIGQEIPTMIQLPSGSNIRSKDIVKELQKQIPDLIFSVINNRFSVTSRVRVKGTAFTFHDPRWTDKSSSLITTSRIMGCYKELGINPGRSVSGVNIYPGWKIITDPNSFVDEKIILFNAPVYNQSPLVQISYFTNAANCRRCFGSRMEFDYGVINGKYETVNNADLLLQEFDKFLFTRQGSHWKWPWLGSKLSERIGGKAATITGSSRSFISADVGQSFKSYQNIKQKQDALAFQMVTDAEFPMSLNDLSVEFDPNDPTIAVVSASLVSRSSQPVELKRIVGVPTNFSITPGGAPYLPRG